MSQASLNLKELLARQLNDHKDSQSGVVQATYTEWHETHIEQAVELGVCYVYSLLPQEFSKKATLTVNKSDCVIDFSDHCERYAGILALEVNGEKCQTLLRREDKEELPDECKTNSLIDLLATPCYDGSESSDLDKIQNTYNWSNSDGSDSVIIFDKVIPVGSVITYLCSTPPCLADLDNAQLCQYHPLIAEYALWWLFRTDTESRSNLARATMHFEAVKLIVETQLLLKFSLFEDDFDYGRRKVADTE